MKNVSEIAGDESVETRTVEEVSGVLREWMESADIPPEARTYLLTELVNRQTSGGTWSSAS